MEKGNKYRFICYIHDDILTMCDELQLLININPLNSKKIGDKIKKIKRYTEDAKSHGQSMETRLRSYKSKIEDLGFKRKKETKK